MVAVLAKSVPAPTSVPAARVVVASPPLAVKDPVTFVLAVPESSCFAPITKTSLKSGVPFDPSHKAHVLGIDATFPFQSTMVPDGIYIVLAYAAQL